MIPGDREKKVKTGSLPAAPGELAGLQLVAGASVEQNSIGHTQIIISQDFKQIPEGLMSGRLVVCVSDCFMIIIVPVPSSEFLQ